MERDNLRDSLREGFLPNAWTTPILGLSIVKSSTFYNTCQVTLGFPVFLEESVAVCFSLRIKWEKMVIHEDLAKEKKKEKARKWISTLDLFCFVRGVFPSKTLSDR